MTSSSKVSPGKMSKAISRYTVLYCPVEVCEVDVPFSESFSLLKHMNDAHDISVFDADGVAPFLDQYLKKYPDLKGPRVLGGETDEADNQVRQKLHLKFLNSLLERQLRERSTVHKRPRGCLFCLGQASCMSELFDHMYMEHRFNIGLLDNLIYADCFLNELDEMLKLKKQCIYCGEVFRNGTCLRKHLKSKNHFKIDSKDSRWDKYYLVNYVNISKSSQRSAAALANGANEEEIEDDSWDDLMDEVEVETQCLFCSDLLKDPEACFVHMKTAHAFDFEAIQKENKLDYYASMKLLNYLRHCQTSAEAAKVFEFPDPKLWNKTEFLFPVYEEDPLLTAIDFGDLEE